MKNLINYFFGKKASMGLSEAEKEPDTSAEITEKEPAVIPLSSLADLNAVVVSDIGNVRRNNEDTGLFVRLADEGIRRFKGYLLLVADGMGGHLAGEIASQMAAEIVSREYFQYRDTIEKSLMRAFQLANRQIFDESIQSERFRGMGTTCTAVVVHEEQLYFAHVGDSRAYLFKNGQLVQLTEDHTYVRELLRSGEITEEAAARHPERNVLMQAMGTKAEIRIDLGRCVLPFDPGDRLLLCSDGLYEYCQEEDLIRLLGQEVLPNVAAELVQVAKNRGGHDNITVVLAERIVAGDVLPPRETREIEVNVPLTRDIERPNA
ncbi:Stp1/IreP family PP2C-type Ser/Thr phosphatase [Larkinella bovis]|uniref:Stp1/IreP family PP2C-type Ser/Thr phosphatase n=1 Tax=Larkinella bovis TaxID=683041 RepID=A0ABW0I942_9BACT